MKMLLMILLVMGVMSTRAQSVSLTVISNEEGAPAELKKSELKQIFRGGKERWSNGKRIKIALMKPNTTSAKNMCKKVFDISSDDFANYWEEQAFAGKADRPVYFKNVADLQAYVAENQGAIGIIDQAQAASQGIIVVSIDGKKSF